MMEHVDHDLAAGPASIPLTILTGFLGAGKTTLLNRILNGNHGLKVAVLVNDFGAINIDAELVVGIDNEVISLANGCICCTLRDDLVATVLQTISRPEAPEYILLEASGVAEPSSIAFTFNNPYFRDRIRLDSILCVVDAEQIFAAPEWMELKLFQMACADMVILNKVDLVDGGHIARIKQWLDSRFHRYRLIEASHCNVPLEVLLSVGHFGAAQIDGGGHLGGGHRCTNPNCSHKHHQDDHSENFSTWSYETDRPLSLEALREAASKLPADVYRAKGVIYAADEPERRAVLHVVGKRVDISLEGEWREQLPRTRIVAIGAYGAMVQERLHDAFEQCLGAANHARRALD